MKRLKTLLAFAVILLLSMSLLCACNQPAEEETGDNEKVVSGMLAINISSEEEVNAAFHELGWNVEVKFFEDLNSLIMALRSGKIEKIDRLPECTARYLVARNEDLDLWVSSPEDDLGIQYYLGVPGDDQETYDILNDAMTAMENDGTVDGLIAEYIDAYMEGSDEPAPAEMPEFPGAKTIKIAITGDLPPFDYVSADGQPAGFNVALLAEIAQRTGVNIEPVSTNAASRAMSLSSDAVDAIFWLTGDNVSKSEIGSGDFPEGIKLIGPYYECASCIVRMK